MKVGDLVNVRDYGVGVIADFTWEFVQDVPYKWASIWLIAQERLIFTSITLVEVINENR